MNIAALVAAIVGLFNRIADWALARQRGSEIDQAKQDGANAADIETLSTLSEIADAQSDNQHPAADGVAAVAGRLRARFEEHAQRSGP
jgi:hypothetical protein